MNILISLAVQIINLLCGFVLPRLMINSFGSEAYGATSSITQFLAYITLLEGGIGGVARAALYKPLANRDIEKISNVVAELRRFFRIIAWIFLGYVVVLACTFTYISDVSVFDWLTTFALVIVISLSTFAQYFIGITYTVLLQAAQKTYITNVFSIAATVLNTILCVLLVKMGCSLLVVKLASSIVFVLRPIALQIYVKREFRLVQPKERNAGLLSQKWTGLGQHIAFFLHSNTDIMVLTIFADLSLVAVYSVYNMIVVHIQSFVSSFASGMESFFGDMLAKQEYEQLNKTFSYYEMMISVVAVILFSTTAILLIPFIKLYTAGITDADYCVPEFGIILVIASLLYCLRLPYHAVTIAAGHFRQTKFAAYGEAVINIGLSIFMVTRYGLIGVAIGTLVATGFRFVYYVAYLSKKIMLRSIGLFVKRVSLNAVIFGGTLFLGERVISTFKMNSYIDWVLYAVASVVFVSAVTIAVNCLFYKDELRWLVKRKNK